MRPPGRTLLALSLMIGLVSALPTVVVVPMSFSEAALLRFPPSGFTLRWYETLLASPTWTTAGLTSALVATCATVGATVLGTCTAVGFLRGGVLAKRTVGVAMLAPLIVSPVVLGIGMYDVWIRLGLAGTVAGLVLAHTAVAVPFVMVVVLVGLRSFDPDLERAAVGLGAPPIRAFLRVTLPQLAPSVAGGALLAFAISWDEVVISLFLSGPTARTLPVVMWSQVRGTLDPTIAAVATLLTAVALVLFTVAVAVAAWSTSR